MLRPNRGKRSFAARFAIAAAVATAVDCSGLASAEDYPSHPITIVVPFPAGAPSDILARLLAEHMRNAFGGQTIIVENVTGASGSIAAGHLAHAANDGYTLGLGSWGTHVLNGALLPIRYDVVKDFQPISLLTRQSSIIVARKDMPANDLRGLIAWLRANPHATQGTTGPGSNSHIAGVLFQKETGTNFTFVPYRGAVLAMRDLISSQIDMLIDLAPNSLPQIRAGAIKAYAVAAKSHLAAAPGIPTVDEAGLPGFYISGWFALFAPKATPQPIVAKLNAAVVTALSDPAVRKRLSDLGQEIFPRDQQTPEALSRFQKSEIDRWWPIMRAAGIKAE